MEKFEVEMPDFSSVELTFSVKDDKDDYVVPGDLNVVFS